MVLGKPLSSGHIPKIKICFSSRCEVILDRYVADLTIITNDRLHTTMIVNSWSMLSFNACHDVDFTRQHVSGMRPSGLKMDCLCPKHVSW